MRVIEAKQSSIVCEFQLDELVALSNAINETLEALPDWEIPIRMGVGLQELRALQGELKQAANHLVG